ncbi:MAG TPA: SdrD B-like domain-containing protein [Herbaspirillum sp.]
MPAVLLLAGLGFSTSALADIVASMNISSPLTIGTTQVTTTSYDGSILPGDITSFRFGLTNNNAISAVNNVSFTDTMPPEIKVAPNGVTSAVCVDGPTQAITPLTGVVAVPGSSVISLTGGTIPHAEASGDVGECFIDVEVIAIKPSGSTTVQNTIGVGDITGNDGAAISNAQSTQQTITLLPFATPTISKSFSPATVITGQPSKLSITIGNGNTGDLPLNDATDAAPANAYAIHDALPAGLQVAAAPNASVTCTGAGQRPTFTPAPNSTDLKAFGGVVAVNGSCTLNVDVVVISDSTHHQRSVVNNISGTTGFGNRRGLAASDASATITGKSALSVSKSFSPSIVAAGETGILTITLKNDGPAGSAAIGLNSANVLTDTPIGATSGGGHLTVSPTGLSSTCPTPILNIVADGGNASGGIKLGANGSIPAGGNCTITVPYVATLGTPGTPEVFNDIIAENAVTTTDPTLVSDQVTASVTVVDQLVIHKSSLPTDAGGNSAVAPGGLIKYTITASNYSHADMTNLVITDPLMAGMKVINAPQAPETSPDVTGNACGAVTNIGSASLPKFQIATVPDGATQSGSVTANPGTCTLTFWAQASITPPSSFPSALTNQIPANSVTVNGGGPGTPTNHDASETAQATLSQNAVVSKVFAPNNTSEGSVSLLTVTLTNISGNALTNATLTDVMPVGLLPDPNPPHTLNQPGSQLLFASPANATTNCGPNATVTADPITHTLTMANGVIPARAANGTGANGSCLVQVKVVGPAGNYDNQLPTGALTATETYGDGTTHQILSPGTVHATLIYNPALSASKSFTPTQISSGGVSTVKVNLSNTSTGALTGVAVTDPLTDPNLSVATPPNARTTCAGAPVITAVAGSHSVSASGMVLPPGGGCDVIFDVIGTGTANWVNTIPPGGITAAGGVQTLSAVTATLTNKTTGSVALDVSTGTATLSAPGDSTTLTINIHNTSTGNISLDGLSLTNYFTANGLAGGAPTGMQVASVPNLSTTCVGGIVTASPDGLSLTLSNASLPSAPPATTAQASCKITANVTMTTTGNITDLIPPHSVKNSQAITNADPVSTSLSAQGNTGVVKSFTPSVIKPSERSRLRLTFISPNVIPLINLTANDVLPNGMIVAPGPNPFTNCQDATVSSDATVPTAIVVKVTGGTLPAAVGGVPSTCYAEIDVQANAAGITAGTLTNVVNANDVTGSIGGGPVHNSSPATATLLVQNPATIGKSFTPAQVKPGALSALAITIHNPNNIPLTNAVLTDALPNNVVVAPQASGHPSTTNCGAGATVTAPVSATSVILTGATIAANTTCTVTVDVLSNISGSYLNTIPIAALSTSEGITNDTPASATLSLLDPPTVTKQFNPVSIGSGGISKLTINLGNTNATGDAKLSSIFTDTLPVAPAPIVIANPSNLVSTCPGAVTAAAGSGTISYPANAIIPHNGGCTITVDVTGSTQGSYNNFIASGNLVTDLGPNADPATANLVITPLGAISGKVFKDNNPAPDGVFNSPTGANPDVGLAGIVMQLTGSSYGPDGVNNNGAGDDTANVLLSAVTDSLGNYSFTNLFAGSYNVIETTQPTGTLDSKVTPGVPGGGTAVQGATPSKISGITLTGAGTVTSSPNNNFAEVAPSSIAGIVFLDQNNNGIKDAADTPLAGVTVELFSTATNQVVSSKPTDAGGAYSFTGLLPLPTGTYVVREPVQPPNTANGKTMPGTTANGGNAGTGSLPSVALSTISGIILPGGVNSTANNFAEVPSGRQIMGTVYGDSDNSGTINGTETGLANVVVVLTGTDLDGNPVNTQGLTDASGHYVFSGLAEGTYTVTEPTQPPRTDSGKTTPGSAGGTGSDPTVVPSTITGIALTGTNTVATDNNFGEIPILTGTVSGKVYIDANNNGIIETGDIGIASVNMTLSGLKADGSTYTQTVSTAGDGTYIFVNVPPSNSAGYNLGETQPALNADGKTTIQAGNPGVASSSKPVLSDNLDTIRGVKVLAGDVLPNYNFGEIQSALGLIPPIVNGYVYLDRNHDRVRADDGSGTGQAGWTVTLTDGLGALVCTVNTNAAGFYQFDNLHCPSHPRGLPTGSNFTIGFTKDGNHLPEVPQSGNHAGTPVPSNGTITGINLPAGSQVVEQNLPLDPSGVVYDSSSRNPVAGAIVTISGPPGFDPTTMLTTGSASQTTGADGLYAFFLQDNGVTPFPNGNYSLSVVAPAGYQPAPSAILPACIGTAAIGAAPNPARIQASDSAPAQSVTVANPAACVGAFGSGATTTQYYFSFGIIHGVSAPILNNHIPLDPLAAGSILVTKTTPLVNVSRGDLVPYTITATNTLANPIPNVAVRDVVPPGFKYRAGSASLNGVRMEPTVAGRVLTWPAQTFAAKEKKVYRLILTVGAGVNTGKYVNQGWALDSGSSFTLSNMATATVNVVPDPTFDCPDVIGKVFDDKNANGYQDQGEVGIPAVRMATVTGLLVTTDAEGRFHVPCPEIPNQDRGSNYVMKLDVRTLPSGYRITTENPRDIRLTRGKVSKLNFGATVHRVVRLELSDAAFEPNTDALLPAWQKQLDALPETLKLRPSVVRLNYQNGKDGPDLVSKRIAAVSKQIKGRWTALKGQYTLNIETEDAQ